MNINIFDTYNIRARLSVYIIIISPLLLTVYTLYSPVRSFSFSAIFIAIMVAFSNYLFALQRYIQKGKLNHSYIAAQFLHLDDTHIDSCTKKRYYQKLVQLDDSFYIFSNPSNSNEFESACSSAIRWLRNNTRSNKLVQEENMLYGFYKNLLSLKFIGIIFTIISILILLLTSRPIENFFQSSINIGLAFVDIFFILFWLFGVTDKICIILSEKYAYALLGALDSL